MTLRKAVKLTKVVILNGNWRSEIPADRVRLNGTEVWAQWRGGLICGTILTGNFY